MTDSNRENQQAHLSSKEQFESLVDDLIGAVQALERAPVGFRTGARNDMVEFRQALIDALSGSHHETTDLRPGELEQLRRIDRAARVYVDSLGKPLKSWQLEDLLNALFDGRSHQETTARSSCIYRSGCKNPIVCHAQGMCVPGTDEKAK